MRYLRMLSNSMAAAALATAYVIALVLHLNPNLPLHPSRFAPLLATVGLYYIVHLTVIFYILLVLRQLLAREVFSPAWISVDVLTWLSAMAAAAGAALMWRNLVAFSLVLDDATAASLLASTGVLTATAVLCLLLALFRILVRTPRQRATRRCSVSPCSGGDSAWLRGPGELPAPARRAATSRRNGLQPPHVRMLLTDGVSLDSSASASPLVSPQLRQADDRAR
jgi:hypothetical protein